MKNLIQIFFLVLLSIFFLQAWSQPVVNLGNDTTVCGSVLLDAGNPGASFLWSTGDTTQTLNINTSALYWVDVTDLSGTSRDSIMVTVNILPAPPSVSDTGVCAAGPLTLSATSPFSVLWYDAATGGNFLGWGSSYTANITDTTTFFSEAVNTGAATFAGTVGPPNNLFGVGGYVSTVEIGQIFDVFETIRINSVKVYANAAGSVTFEIRKAGGQVVTTVTSVVNPSGATLIPVNTVLFPGTGYQIVKTGSASLFRHNTGAVYPYTLSGLLSITGNTQSNPDRYFYFYDWNVSKFPFPCSSVRSPLTVNLLPNPVVDLGADTILCNSSILLDATLSGATYLWSTGETTASITVASSDTVSVEVDLNGCTAHDTIGIQLTITLPPATQDTSICGAGTLTLKAVAPNPLKWYDSPTGGMLLGILDSLEIFVSDTTTFYIEQVDPGLASNVGTVGPPNNNFGLGSYVTANGIGQVFDVFVPITINSVRVYSNVADTVRIELQDALGAVLNSVAYPVSGSGFDIVPLGFQVLSGSGYKLVKTGSSSLYRNNTGATYPYTIPGVISITGNTQSNPDRFFFFFNWDISAFLSPCNSARAPLTVNVTPLPVVDLGPDTVLCNMPVTFDAGLPGATYMWSDGTTNSTYTATGTDTIWVSVTQNGCTLADTVGVLITIPPAQPVVQSFDVCGPSSVNFIASGSSGPYYWYDSLSGGSLIGVGDTLPLFISDTTTLYSETLNPGPATPAGKVGPADFSFGNGSYVNTSGEGLIFDALVPLVIETVKLYSDMSGTVTIELLDPMGIPLDSKIVTVNANVATVVNLGFLVPPGSGFKLIRTGSHPLYRNTTGISYPYTLPGIISLTNSSALNPSRYFFFYDWKVSAFLNPCPSPRGQGTVNVVPVPLVDLGADTILCDDILTLDVSNPGATYLWSTGATTPTLSVSSSDTISVTATLGICPATDTVSVLVLNAPPLPMVNNLDICGPGTASLVVSPNPGSVFWYDSAAGGSLIETGELFTTSVTDTTTFFVESVNLGPAVPGGRVGAPNNGIGTGAIVTNDGIGMIFSVFAPIRIDSVKMYSNLAGPVQIFLLDAGGTMLDSITVMANASGPTIVALGFTVLPGVDYQLIKNNLHPLYRNTSGGNYPYEIPGRISITDNTQNLSARYWYFYDWQISAFPNSCPTPRVAATINVLPSPTVDLGTDTVLCDDVLMLDVSNPNASYLWSTGATTPSLTVATTDTLSVQVSIGPCSVDDTLAVTVLNSPFPPILVNTEVCGPGIVEIMTGGIPGTYFAYDSAIGGSLVAAGDPLYYQAVDSAMLFVESVTLGPTSPGGHVGPPDLLFGNGNYVNTGNDGILFDVTTPIRIDAVSVYSNAAGNVQIFLLDRVGNILDSLTAPVLPTGVTIVPLGFDVMPGQDYALIQANNHPIFRHGIGATYPYILPGVLSLTNSYSLNPDRYYYFYDWEVSVFANPCPSSRTPVAVNVKPAPVLELGNDTLICDNVLVLDASNPGATYLWSSGATSSSITLTGSDTVFVDVAIGSCAATDTVIVEILASPAAPVLPSPVIEACGIGTIPLTASGGANYYFWYDAGGSLVGAGDTAYIYVTDTATYYAEAVNVLADPGFSEKVGPPNNGIAGGGYLTTTNVGLLFNVFTPISIDSVTLFTDVNGTVEISLQNEFGAEVASTSVFAIANVPNRVALDFVVSPGNNYRLLKKNAHPVYRNTGNVFYPYEIPGVLSIYGNTTGNPTRYHFFYDWRVSEFGVKCPSSQVPVTVNVSFPFQFPDSIYSCTETMLDVSFPNANYLWSTGETTSSIQITQTDDYWVEVSDGMGCVVTDSILIRIPAIGLPDDGVLCGNVLSTNFGTDAIFLWSTGDTTPTITASGPGTYWVDVIEPRGCVLSDTITVTSFAGFPTVNLGPDFSACNSALLDAGNPGMTYLWSTGATTQTITAIAAGLYAVTVTNSAGCSESDTIIVNITPSPTALFSWSANGLIVSFNNLSTFGSYLWDFGDGNTSSMISPIHTYVNPGTYGVQLLVSNNCGLDTFFTGITINTSSISDDLEGSIRVFPNPASTSVTVEVLENAGTPATISLTDLAGRIVFEMKTGPLSPLHREIIPTEGYSRGIYYLCIRIKGRTIARKVLLE